MKHCPGHTTAITEVPDPDNPQDTRPLYLATCSCGYWTPPRSTPTYGQSLRFANDHVSHVVDLGGNQLALF